MITSRGGRQGSTSGDPEALEYVGLLGIIFWCLFTWRFYMAFSPLGEADKEARRAMAFPCACGAAFRRSWGYLGPLGSIFGCLGAVLGGSWELLGRSWGGLGRSWGDLAMTFRAV